MDAVPAQSVRFTMKGNQYVLTRQVVEHAVRGVDAGQGTKYAVNISGVSYPVKHVLEAATGVPRSQFTSDVARRHLAALGYEIRLASARPGLEASRVDEDVTKPEVAGEGQSGGGARSGEWHTEAKVQSAVVTALVKQGWKIQAVANTATKQHGIDIIAAKADLTVGVEVKGYPSKHYADPSRAGQTKTTHPSTQAGHWYSQAVLAAMRLRSTEPRWDSVIAMPDFLRYRTLHEETRSSLEAAGIGVWWVSDIGEVTGP